MKRSWFLGVLLALSTSTVAAVDEPPSAASGSNEATVESVFAAWFARNGRILTARAEWTERVFHGRGSLMRNPNLPRPGGDTAEPEILPVEDAAFELTGNLTIDGRQSRFERRGPVWLLDHAYFAPREFVSVYGEREQGQHYSEVPGAAGAMTFLTTGDRAPHAHDLTAFPASFAVRPVDAGLARFSLEGWQLEPGTQRVQGRACVVLVRRDGEFVRSVKNLQWVRRLWLDPERDFVLVQFEEGQGEVVYHHLEIDYVRHESAEWLPSTWKCLFYTAVEPEKLRQQIDGRATRWEVNGPVAAAAFEVPAPPRTWVRSSVAPRESIVRADGSRRPILEEELRRGATHWQLLESEPGQAALSAAAAGPVQEPLLSWLDYAVGAVILLGLVACFAVARRRGPRGTERVVSSSSREKE